jgi:hypothetical protein
MLNVGPEVGPSIYVKMPLQMVLRAASVLPTFCFLLSDTISKHVTQVSCCLRQFVLCCSEQRGRKAMTEDMDVFYRNFQQSCNSSMT